MDKYDEIVRYVVCWRYEYLIVLKILHLTFLTVLGTINSLAVDQMFKVFISYFKFANQQVINSEKTQEQKY